MAGSFHAKLKVVAPHLMWTEAVLVVRYSKMKVFLRHMFQSFVSKFWTNLEYLILYSSLCIVQIRLYFVYMIFYDTQDHENKYPFGLITKTISTRINVFLVHDIIL